MLGQVQECIKPMKQAVPERHQRQRVKWRPLLSKVLALALVVSFIAGLMMSQTPAATSVSGFGPEIVSVETTGDTPSDSGWNYKLVAHSVHCVGHSMAQREARFVAPLSTADEASFPVLRALCSLAHLNPPERPPRF